jgi:hypothetical protein
MTEAELVSDAIAAREDAETREALRESDASRCTHPQNVTLAGLEAQSPGPRPNDEQRARWRRRRELQATAARCYKCDRPLEKVWRVRVGFGYAFFGYHHGIVPWCCACASRTGMWGMRSCAQPCRGCGRLVVDTEYRGYSRLYTACSSNCRKLIHQELRKERKQPLGERVCGCCRKDFAPRRADQRYCSDGCRQRAYRQRKAKGRAP